MLAAVSERYGPPEVMAVREIPDPSPGAGRVRVRVRASSLNPLDVKLREGALRPFLRLRFPAILGFDLAGEVETLGPGVQRLAVGDRVYGRVDSTTGGAHAQRVVVRADVLDQIPARLSFEQAAALPLVGMTALQGLRNLARVRGGHEVLVVGAAGGVGAHAVQIARALGATVSAVAAANSADLARGLGAVRVFDRGSGELDTHEGKFDVVFDTVYRQPYSYWERLLRADGVYVTTGFSPALALRRLFGRLSSRRRALWIISRADGALMRTLSALVTEGKLVPVVDSTWPLPRIADAYRKLEEGHLRGKVVLTVP